MTRKPTYEELEQRINHFEKEAIERKRIEEALRESKARLKALSEAPFEAIFLSEKGICLDQNHAAEMMFGYSRTEAIGRHGKEWIVPEDREQVESNMMSGYEEPYEVTALRKDGTTFPCEIQARMIDYQGRSVRVTALRDITERKQAEAALRESEDKFRSIFQAERDAIMVFDGETFRFIEANDATLDLYGYTKEEFLKLTPFDISAEPEETYRAITKIAGELPTDEYGFHTRMHKRKDGSIFMAEISPSSFILGGRKMICGIVRDATKRIQYEEALRESEEKYRHLSEGTYEAVVWHNKGKIIEANEQYYEMFGYKPEELAGKNAISLTATSESAKFMEEQISLDHVGPYEVAGMKKDGTEFPMEIRVKMMKYKGKMARMAAIRDLTDRKRAEEELQKAHDELERRVMERTKELNIKTKDLEELNAALKVLLDKRGEDKTELQDNVISNVKTLIEPYVHKLKRSGLPQGQKTLLNILESNLNEIVSPFARKLSSKLLNLSHSEIRVANLIKYGKTSKEIAEMLNVTERTIEFHRGSIRKKLGIKNQKTNLKAYLMSLD